MNVCLRADAFSTFQHPVYWNSESKFGKDPKVVVVKTSVFGISKTGYNISGLN